MKNLIEILLKELKCDVRILKREKMSSWKPDIVFLHNVSFLKYGKYFKRLKPKIIAPLYFFWNASSNLLKNLESLIGTSFDQVYVDKYLVTSKRLFREFSFIGIKRSKMHVIEPYYYCRYCDFNYYKSYKNSISNKFRNLDSEVKLVYIGSINPTRVPLKEIIKELRKVVSHTGLNVSFQIYSTRLGPGRYIQKGFTYKEKSLRLSLSPQRLSEMEKHIILSSFHFLLFVPKGRATMDPSMSLIEAVYHLTIPITSTKLPGSEYLPRINVVNRLDQLANKIIYLREALLNNKYPIEELLRKFSIFYDKHRFRYKVKKLFEDIK